MEYKYHRCPPVTNVHFLSVLGQITINLLCVCVFLTVFTAVDDNLCRRSTVEISHIPELRAKI